MECLVRYFFFPGVLGIEIFSPSENGGWGQWDVDEVEGSSSWRVNRGRRVQGVDSALTLQSRSSPSRNRYTTGESLDRSLKSYEKRTVGRKRKRMGREDQMRWLARWFDTIMNNGHHVSLIKVRKKVRQHFPHLPSSLSSTPSEQRHRSRLVTGFQQTKRHLLAHRPPIKNGKKCEREEVGCRENVEWKGS